MEVRNRFKGLVLIDRVPEELWMEVRDIVQEARIKIIPKKKKCKEVKWLNDEVLQIAEKRAAVKPVFPVVSITCSFHKWILLSITALYKEQTCIVSIKEKNYCTCFM